MVPKRGLELLDRWRLALSPSEFGSQQLPQSLALGLAEMVGQSNWAWSMSSGAKRTIDADGSNAQKEIYLPKLISRQWTGTMCLTEAHCGTNLGLLRTKAEPQDDGSFKITGCNGVGMGAARVFEVF